MRTLLLLILLIPFNAFGWGTLNQQDAGSAAESGASLWRSNSADQTYELALSATAARGQRIDITSNFTLNKIVVNFASTAGTLTATCRIGTSADLATYSEEWADFTPTNGGVTLTSVVNPSYTTANSRFYFACIKSSGTGGSNLSYSGNELTNSDDKSTYRTTGSVWNQDYAEEAYDLKFEVWKQ